MFQLEPLMTLRLSLGALSPVGQLPAGQRRMACVAGGRFEGPRLRGVVLPGATDWQWLRADGTLEIDARYVLQTDGGVLIEAENRGLRHGPADVIAALAAGQPVEPSRYFYGTVLRFHCADASLDFLNRTIAVARAERRGAEVAFDVRALT